MKELENYIKQHGKVINDDLLKVDSFLNHQVDPSLMKKMGQAFYEHFKDKNINKVVTIETSGIAPAVMCALYFDVPMVFLKKAVPSTMDNHYSAEVFSFTKNKTYTITVAKEFLNQDDHILFIDDFLANGEAFAGFESIVKEAGAVIEGVGIVIDKAFLKGHKMILDKGYNLCSLASIVAFENGEVVFEDEA